MMNLLYFIILVYLISMAMCSLTHFLMENHRQLKNWKDFFLMTCLPWVLFKLIKDKESLK